MNRNARSVSSPGPCRGVRLGGAIIGLASASLVLVATVEAQEGEAASGAAEPFRYVRVHADSAGVSHFADEAMGMVPVDVGGGIPPVPASEPVAAAGGRILCFPAGTVVDWHAAPRRKLYFLLSGGLELEVGHGEVRRFGPGSALLGEATHGRGVRARWSERERGCVLVAPAPDPRPDREGGPRAAGHTERSSTMSHVDLVRGYFEKFFTGPARHTEVRALLTDDFRFRDPLMSADGADDYVAQLAALGDELEMYADVRELIGSGDVVAALVDVRGPSGPIPYAQWFTMRDGKIAALEVIYDPRPFLEADAGGGSR